MSAVPIVIMALTKKYIRIFKDADAITPHSAILPQEHGIRDSLVFKKMVRQGILVKVGNERYYLDLVKELEIKKQRHTMVMIVLGIILILMIISLFFTKS
jgi:hypothetical protein